MRFGLSTLKLGMLGDCKKEVKVREDYWDRRRFQESPN